VKLHKSENACVWKRFPVILYWQLLQHWTEHVSTGPNQCDFTTTKFSVTFRVSGRRREMYSGHGCLCVCLSLAAFPHYCTYPDVTWQNVRGWPLVAHCWADLQSVHGFRCYDNLAANTKRQRVFVLALCMVSLAITVGLLGYIITWRCCLTDVSQLWGAVESL